MANKTSRLKHAFLQVYELACDNALDEQRCDDEEMVEAAKEQAESLELFHKYVTAEGLLP